MHWDAIKHLRLGPSGAEWGLRMHWAAIVLSLCTWGPLGPSGAEWGRVGLGGVGHALASEAEWGADLGPSRAEWGRVGPSGAVGRVGPSGAGWGWVGLTTWGRVGPSGGQLYLPT